MTVGSKLFPHHALTAAITLYILSAVALPGSLVTQWPPITLNCAIGIAVTL